MIRYRVERWFDGHSGEHVVLGDSSSIPIARFSDAPNGPWAGEQQARQYLARLHGLEYRRWNAYRAPIDSQHPGETQAEIASLCPLLTIVEEV